jgi:hypothetical protein
MSSNSSTTTKDNIVNPNHFCFLFFDGTRASHVFYHRATPSALNVALYILNAIYIFNAITIKILANSSTKIYNMIPKFIWKCKGPSVARTILRKKKLKGLHFPVSKL